MQQAFVVVPADLAGRIAAYFDSRPHGEVKAIAAEFEACQVFLPPPPQPASEPEATKE